MRVAVCTKPASVYAISQSRASRRGRSLPFRLQTSHGRVRSSVAFALLALFLAPLCLSLVSLASPSEVLIPQCCRAHGKHKCSMRMENVQGALNPTLRTVAPQVSERCPYSPAAPASLHNGAFGQPHPSAHPLCRTSDLQVLEPAHEPLIRRNCGAHQKRGPPTHLQPFS
jgi:hypothetical protein